jgi:hypothetical protein
MQGPASGWARHGCTPSPSRDSLYHPEAASTTVADSSQSMPRRYCKKQQVLLSSVSPLHMGPAPCTPKNWDRSARRPILHRPSPRLPRLPPPSDQQFLQNPINRGGHRFSRPTPSPNLAAAPRTTRSSRLNRFADSQHRKTAAELRRKHIAVARRPLPPPELRYPYGETPHSALSL